jgi:hypothetical protein
MNDAPSSKRRWGIVALVAVVVAAAITVGGIVITRGSSAEAVSLESADNAGKDPFTASVAIGPAADFPGNVEAIVATTRKSLPTDPKTKTLVATGTKPGLYGGSGDVHVCKPDQLVAYLKKNPSKAAAWAKVLGIDSSGIQKYVASLTPVVLTSDTLVTNHGYHDGHATSLQSVLQAGTAVMVDATGTPRVKCNCGNPLTSPQVLSPTNTTGTRWTGYSPEQVVVVHGGTTVTNLTLININTGDTYDTPVGSGGGEFVALGLTQGGASTAISVSSNGVRWVTASVRPGELKAIAWGDGKWIALASQGETTSIIESSDLKSWSQVTTVPDQLADVSYADGQWIAVGHVTVHATSDDEMAGEFPPAAVYASKNGTAWQRVASIQHAPPFTGVAYANGTWTAVGNGIHEGGSPSFVYRSTDGVQWTAANAKGLDDVTFARIAYGTGKLVIGGLVAIPTGPGQSGVTGTSVDGTSWTTTSAAFANNPVTGVAYGNGLWLAVGAGATDYVSNLGSGSTNVFASSDATSWSQRARLAPGAVDLAFGGAGDVTGGIPAAAPTAPASTTSTTPPTTTAPAATGSDLRSIDWRNYSYNDFVCGSGALVKATNGTWTDPSEPNCGFAVTAVDYADVTGDGKTDAVVNLGGNASGVAAGIHDVTVVFISGPNGPKSTGYLPGESFPPYSSSGLTTWTPYRGGSDPM